MNPKSTLLAISLLLASNLVYAMQDNMTLPEPIRVPDGHEVKMNTIGIGELTYVCKEIADKPGSFGWNFVAPDAVLFDQNKNMIGKYYGGPTWETKDGGKITGKQQAVAPSSAGNIPLQLVKTSPGKGSLEKVSYIQRLNTMGGIAPNDACDGSLAGKEQKVKYQADYVFYIPKMMQ